MSHGEMTGTLSDVISTSWLYIWVKRLCWWRCCSGDSLRICRTW